VAAISATAEPDMANSNGNVAHYHMIRPVRPQAMPASPRCGGGLHVPAAGRHRSAMTGLMTRSGRLDVMLSAFAEGRWFDTSP
jgi:hypothetical protein